MRRQFAKSLLDHAIKDKRIILLTGDLGMGMWDEFQHLLPEQFINTGASEQTLLDMAVGLSYSGKIPFCYSITSFLLYRGFETIRSYINHEKLNVKLIGSGRDTDYHIDGYSHDSSDAKQILNILPNIVQYWPEKKESIASAVADMLAVKKPCFISLRR